MQIDANFLVHLLSFSVIRVIRGKLKN